MAQAEIQANEAVEQVVERKLGSLTVVGLGIRTSQLTIEVQNAITDADVVFVVSNNIPGLVHLDALNKNVQHLQKCYDRGKSRKTTYAEMTQLVMDEIHKGSKVCFAAYGHAGMFANPTHAAIKQAREEGYSAVMLPGISAEDCLFADLGLDPAPQGCQSFEASDFLLRERIWDPYSILVIWQAALIGISTYPEDGTIPKGFALLRSKLVEVYGSDHTGTLYVASMYALCDATIQVVKLSEMKAEDFRLETTLVITPSGPAPRHNEEFAKMLF
jgi:uroporphyrin-III C-methyltransferase